MIKMTDESRVLILLKEGRSISKIEMLQECGVLNGGYPIFKLRQAGHDIRRVWDINKTTGKRYARYYLVAEGVRRVF